MVMKAAAAAAFMIISTALNLIAVAIALVLWMLGPSNLLRSAAALTAA